ncbi:MAG: Ribosome-binding factor A, partial [uncultured Gemmatimonadetes bacterium]
CRASGEPTESTSSSGKRSLSWCATRCATPGSPWPPSPPCRPRRSWTTPRCTSPRWGPTTSARSCWRGCAAPRLSSARRWASACTCGASPSSTSSRTASWKRPSASSSSSARRSPTTASPRRRPTAPSPRKTTRKT